MAGYELEKLTDCKWVNLYNAHYNLKNGDEHTWILCSRKQNPIHDASKPDAVYIVPIIKTPDGNKLVVTKEFRVPIWDYEYGFPAGLVDDGEDIETTVKRELKEETGLELRKINYTSMPVYSTAGMSDESCLMVIVEAAGQISDAHLEGTEDIQAMLFDIEDIKKLLNSNQKIAAKAWGMFYHFAAIGEIKLD